MSDKLKLTEIARRIDAHLKRFEADKTINERHPRYGTTPFYRAGCAYVGGPWISVMYVAYQNSSSLKREEAMTYLNWLDAGNVGRHYRALQDATKTA